MRSPGNSAQGLTVALLMVSLLGPVGGGLAGVQVGMSGEPGESHAAMEHHSTTAAPATGHHDGMATEHCGEPGSDVPHRCAGLWSTACCDYFAPGTKIEIDPSLELATHVINAFSVTWIAESLEPASTWGHLILPTSGESRAGPTSLVILHSALLF